MRFGSTDTLAFDVDPVEPSWERRAAGDLGPWARLCVIARDRVLTRAEIRPAARVVESVHVPLAPLCAWWHASLGAVSLEESARLFRTDVDLHRSLDDWNRSSPPMGEDDAWEDARYAWYTRHFWLAGAEGAWVPDLAFVRADDRLWISWGTPTFLAERAPRFLEPPGCVDVPWGAALSAVDDLCGFVADELRKRGLATTFAWAQTSTALANRKWTAGDLARALGGDRATHILAVLGITADESADAGPSLLALRDLETGDSTLGALREMDARSKLADGVMLAERRSALSECVRAPSPTEAGYDAARAVRASFADPIAPLDDEALQHLLGTTLGIAVEERELPDAKNLAACGYRLGFRPVADVFRNKRTSLGWVRRMELARAAGHLLLDPLSGARALGAGSSARSIGPRRRRSGAFAAELMLPSAGIRKVLEDLRASADEPAAFAALMDRFGVGARTTAYHLWNRRFLRSAEDRDGLIDAFGAQGDGR